MPCLPLASLPFGLGPVLEPSASKLWVGEVGEPAQAPLPLLVCVEQVESGLVTLVAFWCHALASGLPFPLVLPGDPSEFGLPPFPLELLGVPSAHGLTPFPLVLPGDPSELGLPPFPLELFGVPSAHGLPPFPLVLPGDPWEFGLPPFPLGLPGVPFLPFPLAEPFPLSASAGWVLCFIAPFPFIEPLDLSFPLGDALLASAGGASFAALGSLPLPFPLVAPLDFAVLAWSGGVPVAAWGSLPLPFPGRMVASAAALSHFPFLPFAPPLLAPLPCAPLASRLLPFAWASPPFPFAAPLGAFPLGDPLLESGSFASTVACFPFPDLPLLQDVPGFGAATGFPFTS